MHEALLRVLRPAFARHLDTFHRTLAAIEPAEHLTDHLPSDAPIVVLERAIEVLERRGLLDQPRTWELLASAAPIYADEFRMLAAARSVPVVATPMPAWPLPDEPFKDLLPYSTADAAIFFGRRALIQTILHEIAAPGPRIVILQGPTGVGKSSLLQAGVFPRLPDGVRGIYAKHTANAALLDTLRSTLGGAEIESAWAALEGADGRVLVAIDQLEAAYTTEAGEARGDRELDALLAAIEGLVGAAGRARGKLCLCVRKEWLADVHRVLLDRGSACSTIEVRPLDADDIREIIVGPMMRRELAEKYNIVYERGLAKKIAWDIAQDLGSPVAPTLQILLTQLWRECSINERGTRKITLQQYKELGRSERRFEGFVRGRLGALERSPTIAAGAAAGLALDLLFECTTPARTATPVERRQLIDKYGDSARALIDECSEARLLRCWTEGDREYVTLTHDTLAPVIRRLFTESTRAGQRARRRLERKVEDYRETRQLSWLSELDLEIIHAGKIGMRRWNEEEALIVQESERALQQRNAAAAAEARREAEAAEALRAETWRRRRFVRRVRILVGLSVVAILCLITYVVIERRSARELMSAMRVRETATYATSSISRRDHALGGLLAYHAYSTMRPSNQTELTMIDDALRTALSTWHPAAQARFGTLGARALALSADGRELLVAALPGRLTSFELGDASLVPGPALDDAEQVQDLTWSPAIGWVAAGCDGTVRIWGGAQAMSTPVVLSGPLPALPTLPAARCLLRIDVGPNGDRLASGGAERVLWEWRSLTADTTPANVWTHDHTINAVAYGPHGWLASADQGGVIKVGTPGSTPEVHDTHQAIHDIAWRGDRIYAVGAAQGKLWEIDVRAEGERIVLRPAAHDFPQARAGAATAVVAVPYDDRIATAHDDGRILLWRVSDGPGVNVRVLTADGAGTIDAHEGAARALRFVAPGERLVSAGDDGMVRVFPWRAPPALPRTSQLALRTIARGTRVGVDAMAMTDADGVVSLWRRDANGWVRTPEPVTVGVAAVSPDGHWRVHAADDELRVHGPGVERSLPLDRAVVHVAIDDGKWVAASSGSSELLLWSLAEDTGVRRIATASGETIGAVALSGRGDWLAYGGRAPEGAFLRLLSPAASRLPPISLEPSGQRVIGIGFFDDDRRLISITDNGVVREFPTTAALAERACDYLGDTVSIEAWRLAMGDAHEHPCQLRSAVSLPEAAPAPVAPEQPLFAGCREIEDGPVCVLDDATSAVRIWTPAETERTVEVLIDGVATIGATVRSSRDGHHITLVPGAEEGTITVEGPTVLPLQLAFVVRPAPVVAPPPGPRPSQALAGAKYYAEEAAQAAGELGLALDYRATNLFGGAYEEDPTNKDAFVAAQRHAQACVVRGAELGLYTTAADAVWVTAIRAHRAAQDPGLTLAWLDRFPVATVAARSQPGVEAAYARGAAFLDLSGRTLLDAELWLRRASTDGRRLELGPNELSPIEQQYARALGEMHRHEQALRIYERIALAPGVKTDCERAEFAHNRGWLRLDAMERGLWYGDPLADIQVAIDWYARISATDGACFTAATRASIYADAALAACRLGRPHESYLVLARTALVIAANTVDRRVHVALRYAEACARASSVGSR